MAIIGESFKEYVNDQIDVRQKIYGKSISRSHQELVYLNGKSSWVRLISSVDIKNNPSGSNDEGTKKLQSLGLNDTYLGSKLAKEYVLFAGVSNANNTTTEEDFGGSRDPKILVGQPNIKDLRFGVNNGSYGLGGTEYGLQPMPTLGDVEIKYKNRGSLRESNLTIKCFNAQQFQIIDTLYLHIGYTVLLEWGNSCYFNNNGEFVSNNLISMQDIMFDSLITPNHLEMLQSILYKRDQSNGNYDAFYGKVSNYSWTFDNGVYNINLKLISLGDVIESLNINYLSKNIKDQKQETKDENPESPTIDNQKDKNDLARLFYFLKPEKSLVKGQKNTTPSVYVNNFQTANFFSNAATSTHKEEMLAISNQGKNQAEFYSLEYIANLAGFKPANSNIEFSKNNTDFLRINIFNDNNLQQSSYSPFYIKFSTLLEFLEKTQQFYNKGGIPIIKYDYEVGKSFMNTNKWVISSNPQVCIINPGEIKLSEKITKIFNTKANEGLRKFTTKYLAGILDDQPLANWWYTTFKNQTQAKFNVFEDLSIPEFKVSLGGTTVGDIMNIYLNVEFIFNILVENLDAEKESISIFKFLDSICQSLNNSLGSLSSLAPFIDESTNTLSIIEEGELPNKDQILKELELPNKSVELQLYGYNSGSAGFVKNFNLKTEITNDLAVITSIGAQASSESIKGINATAFNLWNRGLIDRFFTVKTESQTESQTEETDGPTNLKDKLEKDYGIHIVSYVRLLKDYLESDGFAIDDIGTYKNGLKGIIEYEKELYKIDNPNSVSQPGFLPINLNLTLDGISGPTILQQFKTNGRFLPSPINETLTFLIKGLTQKISNNIWTTTIDSLAVPKNIGVDSINTSTSSTILSTDDAYQDFVKNTPWSACFISWIVYRFELLITSSKNIFPYSAAHTKYAQDIKDGKYPLFTALDPSKTPIKKGDIIIFNRNNSKLLFDSSNWYPFQSHGDIVFEKNGNKIRIIGGNKGYPGAVKKVNITLDSKGQIPSGKIGTSNLQYFAIIRYTAGLNPEDVALANPGDKIGDYALAEFDIIVNSGLANKEEKNMTVHDNDPRLYPFLDKYYKIGKLSPPPLPTP